LIGFLHTLCVVSLSVYGIQAILLTVLYLRHRGETPLGCDPDEQDWPLVAIQLPIYNEMHVVERLIDAAASLDYPVNKLEVQVLDDSTDGTALLAEGRAAFHRARGVNVRVLRRPTREGFKAGALAWGLQNTEAEYLAVFDADFAPRPDFLRRTIPHLLARPGVGVLQTRWSHLNEAYSALTRLQALALNGHFVVEQTGRSRSDLLINFNGSGGVWRRSCVEEAGGWQWDTMTEDMDLSYRAQLVGWRSLYLPDVDAPAELPPQMEAFKRQQSRWAQGSTQCLRKIGPLILKSDLEPRQKLMALIHISSYLTQPIMVVLLLTTLPVLWYAQPTSSVLGGLWVVSLGTPFLYLVAESRLYRDWARRLLYFPALAAVFAGISWSTSLGVWQGLTRWGGTFRRTPKFRLEGSEGHWTDSAYRLLPDGVILGELFLLLYASITIWAAWTRHQYGAIPFLLLFVIGFGAVAGSGIWQGLRRLRAPSPAC
jgi:cellulose synthase/poly-beta-1,6-N-acetylglucosamine synthase-like glycosyltransferase